MPTYEYQCNACDHFFEEFQSMSAAPLKKCPKCGKRRLRRLISGGAAILFKGSGFYETDYRSESYKQAAKAEQEASSSSSADNGKAGDNGKASTSTSKSSETSSSAGKSSKSES